MVRGQNPEESNAALRSSRRSSSGVRGCPCGSKRNVTVNASGGPNIPRCSFFQGLVWSVANAPRQRLRAKNGGPPTPISHDAAGAAAIELLNLPLPPSQTPGGCKDKSHHPLLRRLLEDVRTKVASNEGGVSHAATAAEEKRRHTHPNLPRHSRGRGH